MSSWQSKKSHCVSVVCLKKEDKIEDGNEKDVGIAEASSTLIEEGENNESRKNRLSRICEKYKIKCHR